MQKNYQDKQPAYVLCDNIKFGIDPLKNSLLWRSVLTDIKIKYKYTCIFTLQQKESTILFKLYLLTNHWHGYLHIQDNFYPQKLQQLGTKATIQLLRSLSFEKMKNYVKNKIKSNKKYINPYFCSKKNNMKFVFSKKTYKHNRSLQMMGLESYINPLHSYKYQVFKCRNTLKNKSRVFYDAYKQFIDQQFNPLLQYLSDNFKQLYLLKNVKQAVKSRKSMLELIEYSVDHNRHQDDGGLFDPSINDPSDGLISVWSNYINAYFNKDNKLTKNNKASKTFCPSPLPNENHGHCNGLGATPFNQHYNNIKAGDGFVMVGDTAYYYPHRTEECNVGHTSIILHRNCVTDIENK